MKILCLSMIFVSLCNIQIYSSVETNTSVSGGRLVQLQSLTETEKILLDKERKTNLIIINDIFEINQKNFFSNVNLSNALRSEQVVLCTKSVWISLVDMYKIDFLTVLQNKLPNEIRFVLNNTIKNKQYQRLLNLLQQSIQSLENLDTIHDNLKNMLQKDLEIKILTELGEDNNEMLPLFYLISELYKEVLKRTARYKEILSKGYICKSVGNDYLLFIPQAMQHKGQRPEVRDALLGLSYTHLSNYNYFSDVDETILFQIKSRMNSLANSFEVAGKILLDALEIIKFKNSNISIEKRPFFNILLMGHGSLNFVAEIPIFPIINASGLFEKSYFLKIMNFFNMAFRTKTLGIYACFAGGKKLKDAYLSYNKFDNVFLENLSFSIINVGTLQSNVYTDQEKNFKNYFEFLNMVPSDYSRVVGFFQEIADYSDLGKLDKNRIDNYVSVKLPHTSWFLPAELDQKTLSLFQIDMLTKTKEINLDLKEVVVLGANYIPRTLNFDGKHKALLKDLPVFLPSNYYVQVYIFESLKLTNLAEEVSLFSLLSHLTSKFFSGVQEPIVMLFETIEIESKKYRKINCSTNFLFMSKRLSGYSYTDSNESIKQFFWPSHTFPEVVQETQGNKQIVDSIYALHKFNIKKILPKSLEPEFLKELSEKTMISDEARAVGAETASAI